MPRMHELATLPLGLETFIIRNNLSRLVKDEYTFFFQYKVRKEQTPSKVESRRALLVS